MTSQVQLKLEWRGGEGRGGFTHIELLCLESFLEVVFFAFESNNESVQLVRFRLQLRSVRSVDVECGDALLEDGLLLRFQLLLRFLRSARIFCLYWLLRTQTHSDVSRQDDRENKCYL